MSGLNDSPWEALPSHGWEREGEKRGGEEGGGPVYVKMNKKN